MTLHHADSTCCSTSGDPGANHDELAGAGSRKLLFFPPRCDAIIGPNVPVTAAAFLLVRFLPHLDQTHDSTSRSGFSEVQMHFRALNAESFPAALEQPDKGSQFSESLRTSSANL